MAHVHEKIDFVVEVFIAHEGRVLLRYHEKYHKWLGVGGHIELDEDPVETAIRECKEEVGLDIRVIPTPETFANTIDTELTPPAFLNRHRISDTHEHVALVYLATCDSKDTCEPDGEEKSGGLRWMTEAELGDPAHDIMDNIRAYGKAAIQAATLHKS